MYLVATLLACGGGPPDTTAVEAAPGAPLPALTEPELQRFAEGQRLFNRAFTTEEGLGPLFNQMQCSACHDLPTSGGHGAEQVVKATRFDATSGCDVLAREGGDLLQKAVVPALHDAGLRPERTPTSATALARVSATPLYGLGLVEAVAEADILERADPQDDDADGISGRAGFDAAGAFARFGRKATHATLRNFIEDALRLEMGLTTPAHPEEERLNGEPLPQWSDPASDPEVGEETIAALTDYVRLLALPGPRLPEDEAGRGEVREGERLFDQLGCTACHVPTMRAGPDGPAAIAGRRFRIYSDLLLHDMGAELADICAPGAAPSEWRTTPLVGLSLRHEYLHNGRAQRVEDAVLLHGGEAERARELFSRLDRAAKDRLLAFLSTL